MIYLKKYGHMLAACDENLLGKIFEEGERVLNVKQSFYKGSLVNEEEFLKEFKKSNNSNLIGSKTINAVKKVMPVQSLTIKNIEYAIIIKV